MKTTFDIPQTPTVKVHYRRDGVLYSTVIVTPNSNQDLQMVMLGRYVGISQVERLEAIQPRQPLHRNHPAIHRISQYVAAAS